MQLNFKQLGQGFPLIMLHGLLGSLDNLQSIAKELSNQFTVYLIDQRNHGKSPHSEAFDYDLLAADLLHFMEEKNIEKAHLFGHSMGGKTAMHFALLHPEKVAKLIVADIAPYSYSDQHTQIFEALLSVDLAKVNSRDEVQNLLLQKLEDKTTVFFLMKGLSRDDQNAFAWKFNVESLCENYPMIAGFPDHTQPYDGKALFLKGQHSDYINARTFSEVLRLFSNNELTEIEDSGHWLHADNPIGFLQAVNQFLVD